MKKTYLILPIVIVGIGFVFYRFQTGSIVSQPEIVGFDKPTIVPAKEVAQSPIVSSSSHSSSSSDVALSGRMLTESEMSIKKDWMRKTGRSNEDLAAYEYYSDDQLMDLIDQGDINAMFVIGQRKLVSGGGIEAAIPFSQKEIIYGGLRGISSMASYMEPSLTSGLPFEDLKKQLMESVAYYELYAIRGDNFTANLGKNTQIDVFKQAYKLDKVFNADEEALISKRARELYDFYQAERNKLGLGNFDNEVPNEVKEFFGE